MANSDDDAGNQLQAFLPRSALSPALLPGALTDANSDRELIALWLTRPNISPETHRHGEKEATRFLMWCRLHALGLRDVRYEHLLMYSAFIADPQPAADWVAPHKYRRNDPRWRPFVGKLQAKSQIQTLIVLKALFSWAKSAGYLAADPSELLGRLSPSIPARVQRYLPQTAVPYLLAAAEQLPDDKQGEQLRKIRARFTVIAYYCTAARLFELVRANMGSFEQTEHGRWWLHVIGKGARAGKVPVPPELIDELKLYRSAFGLPPLPGPDEATPLLMSSRGKKGRATTRTVARSVKLIFKHAADIAEEGGQHPLAARIRKASTHWLRHSQLTHQVDNGAELKTVQLNARHASISTTGIYLHKEDDTRHDETTKAQLRTLASLLDSTKIIHRE